MSVMLLEIETATVFSGSFLYCIKSGLVLLGKIYSTHPMLCNMLHDSEGMWLILLIQFSHYCNPIIASKAIGTASRF